MIDSSNGDCLEIMRWRPDHVSVAEVVDHDRVLSNAELVQSVQESAHTDVQRLAGAVVAAQDLRADAVVVIQSSPVTSPVPLQPVGDRPRVCAQELINISQFLNVRRKRDVRLRPETRLMLLGRLVGTVRRPERHRQTEGASPFGRIPA